MVPGRRQADHCQQLLRDEALVLSSIQPMILVTIGLALYIGIGVGITLIRDDYYDVEDFLVETTAWPFVVLEPLGDFVVNVMDSVFEFIDTIFEQIGDIFDWVSDNTIGRVDDLLHRPIQRQKSGKGSINIQAGDDLDMTIDREGNVYIKGQEKGRALRKNKKSPEVIDLQKNPLE
jgi:hypothetical protein